MLVLSKTQRYFIYNVVTLRKAAVLSKRFCQMTDCLGIDQINSEFLTNLPTKISSFRIVFMIEKWCDALLILLTGVRCFNPHSITCLSQDVTSLHWFWKGVVTMTLCDALQNNSRKQPWTCYSAPCRKTQSCYNIYNYILK